MRHHTLAAAGHPQRRSTGITLHLGSALLGLENAGFDNRIFSYQEGLFADTRSARTASYCNVWVSGWEPASAGLDLPDPDDRHVLAAAITGGGQSLVTFNLKDFPDDKLVESRIEAVHPDEFLLDQLGLQPGLTLQALTEQAADANRPPMDLQTLLNILERCGVPQFVDQVRLLLP